MAFRIRSLSTLLLVLLVNPTWLYGQRQLKVLASHLNPEAKDFDTTRIWLPEKTNNKVLVHLVGTWDNTGNNTEYLKFAAQQGYLAICLSYNNTNAATELLPKDPKPATFFSRFRSEICTGTSLVDSVAVNQANSIEGRLTSLFELLTHSGPQISQKSILTVYNASQKTIIWNRLYLSGHSQGAGHAGFLGKLHQVERVIMMGGPKDGFHQQILAKNQPPDALLAYSKSIVSPQDAYLDLWITKNGATPSNQYFSFLHQSDEFGFDLPLHVARLLTGYDTPTVLSGTKANPALSSRILVMTDRPANNTRKCHEALVQDAAQPADKNLLEQAWRILLQ